MNSVSCKRALPVALLLFVSCILVQTASAATVNVGTCANNPYPIYAKIQPAIDGVPAGSTINVCPGTYPEQLSINKALTLIGIVNPNNHHDSAVITSPAGGLAANSTRYYSGLAIAANVLVDGATGVNLTNLVVDSSGNNINACAPVLVGIVYENASGTLSHVETRNQWLGASESDINYNGCQSGVGILAQTSTGTTALTVGGSSVHDYQKNGIAASDTGTTLTVSNSFIMGQGPTNGAAENGIEIVFGAGGTVTGNTVINDIYAPAVLADTGNAATGILLYDAKSSGVTVQSNTVINTQYGIALVQGTTGLDNGESVLSNSVYSTQIFDAIDVCSNSNSIKTNRIFNGAAAESAIHLDASCGSTGNNNTVTGNAVNASSIGILKDSGISGNTLGSNTFNTTFMTVSPF